MYLFQCLLWSFPSGEAESRCRHNGTGIALCGVQLLVATFNQVHYTDLHGIVLFRFLNNTNRLARGIIAAYLVAIREGLSLCC